MKVKMTDKKNMFSEEDINKTIERVIKMKQEEKKRMHKYYEDQEPYDEKRQCEKETAAVKEFIKSPLFKAFKDM